MINMMLKQFLKPDKRKIIVFIVLLFLGFLTFFSYISLWAGPYDLFFLFLLFCLFILYPFIFILGIVDSILTPIILSLIYQYLLSCLMVWIYDKVKNNNFINTT